MNFQSIDNVLLSKEQWMKFHRELAFDWTLQTGLILASRDWDLFLEWRSEESKGQEGLANANMLMFFWY